MALFLCAKCGLPLASARNVREVLLTYFPRPALSQGWQCSSSKKLRSRRRWSDSAFAARAAASDIEWLSEEEEETDLVATEKREPLLDFDRRGYHTIALEGCEYLFAETEDGRLDLRDAVVYYPEEDMYLRPEAEGEMPDAPLHFDELEWAAEFAGDTIMNAAPWRKVQRVYLVEVTDMDSYSLNLETVFMLDRATRKLSRCAVERAPGVTEDSDNVLRITPQGLVLQRAEDMPSPDTVIAAHESEAQGGLKQLPAATADASAGEEAGLDPIEADWDDELGKPEDTPAIDYLGD